MNASLPPGTQHPPSLTDPSRPDDAYAARPGHPQLNTFQRALNGDRAAFGQFVLDTQDRLYTLLVRILGDRDDARETAQDTYLKALSSLHTFRGHSSAYTWLYRIAVNLAITRLRKVRRHRTFNLPPQWTRADPAANPADAAILAEQSRQVLSALGRLDGEYRTILVLRDVDDLDYPQIAEVLQVPLGTVKSRLFRARLALRHELQRFIAAPASPNPPGGPR